MAQNSMHFGGVPQDPDIRKLREAYPEQKLEDGQVISYAEIERLLLEHRGSNRWKGVTSKWRKQVKEETGIVIGVERGKGFKVLQDSEKAGLCKSLVKYAANQVKKSLEVSLCIDHSNLSHRERQELDFQTNKAAKMKAMAQVRSPKNLLPGKEAK